jgi:hypothetical protein
MDSNDLEREKGITILAKQTAVDYDGIRLNIVDTPGHADFGGEVERSLNMVDSVLLLVDAAEGPLPQTRYVLQKAMSHHLPVVVAINKIDRSDARSPKSSTTSTSCSWTSARTRSRSTSRSSTPTPRPARRRWIWRRPGTDLRPLFELLIEHTPAPRYIPDHPLQLLVTNLSANDYVGRMAVGRVWNGTIKLGGESSSSARRKRRHDGTIEPGRTITLTGTVTSLTTAHGIERVDIESGGPGRHRRAGGHPRRDDRRHHHGSGRSAADAAPGPRRADAEHDLRGQHVAALRARGQVRHQPPHQAAAREGSPRQRLDPVRAHGLGRHVRGPRPRRTSAGHPDRADAPRRATSCRSAAPRSSCGRSAARPTSRTSASPSTSRRSSSAPSRPPWPTARAVSSR